MGVEKIPWETKLAILARYKEAQGTAVVPTRYIDPDSGFRLGGWVHHLRQTRSKLTAGQVQILEQMGFVWNASKEWPWETKLEALKRFYQEHAHYRVPRLYVDDVSGFKLGQWVPSLRRKNASLKASRRRDLIKIGFFTGNEMQDNEDVDEEEEEEGSEQEDNFNRDHEEHLHLQVDDSNNIINMNPESSSSINGDSTMGGIVGVGGGGGAVMMGGIGSVGGVILMDGGSTSDGDNNNDSMDFAIIPQMALSNSAIAAAVAGGVGVDDVTSSASIYSGHNIFMGAGGDEAMMNMLHSSVSGIVGGGVSGIGTATANTTGFIATTTTQQLLLSGSGGRSSSGNHHNHNYHHHHNNHNSNSGSVMDSISQGLASMRQPLEQLKASASTPSPSTSAPYQEESIVQVYEL